MVSARSGSAAAPLRLSTEGHTIGNLAWDADLLAPVLARNLDGRPGRPAGIGLQAGGR